MNPKTRMRHALECKQPSDCVPIWELSFHAWDQASGRHIVLGHEFEKLTAGEQEKALHENADIICTVVEQFHFAGLTLIGGYWEVAPGQPTYCWLPDPARWELARLLVERVGSEILLVGSTGGVMHMPNAHEYVEFSYKLFDAPEEIDAQANQVYEQGMEVAKRMRDLGVECVKTSSDLADNHGPFFNQEQMDRFILPYLRKWSEAVAAMDMYSILHTDGNIESYVEDIANSGVHALQAIDPVAGMDIRKVKQQVGDRLCLCGNVDCGLLLSGPVEKVHESTVDLLKTCKPGGGFVLGASNAVVHQTPIENYQAMIRAWEEHGGY